MSKRKEQVKSEELPEPEAIAGGEEVSPAPAAVEPEPVEEAVPLVTEPEATGIEGEELEEVPVSEAVELPVAEPHEPEPAPVAAGKKPARGPEPPLVEVVPARVGWGRLLFVGLLSAILGAFLALLFLFMVNGTLDFRRAAVQAAQDEAVRLEDEVGTLGAKLAQIEEQIGAVQELDRRLADVEASLGQVATNLQATQTGVEAMAGTMDALRQEFTNLREDLDGQAGHVSALEGRLGNAEEQLTSVSQQIEALGVTLRRFDAFLNGLRELLDQGTGALPPTPSSAAPTSRPSVTVIPLATPTPAP